MAKSRYDLYNNPRLLKDIPNSVWSLTETNGRGETFCYQHGSTAGPLVETMDYMGEQLGAARINLFKVWHHYGPCRFCGKDENGRRKPE